MTSHYPPWLAISSSDQSWPPLSNMTCLYLSWYKLISHDLSWFGMICHEPSGPVFTSSQYPWHIMNNHTRVMLSHLMTFMTYYFMSLRIMTFHDFQISSHDKSWTLLTCHDLPWIVVRFLDLSWPLFTCHDLSWPANTSFSCNDLSTVSEGGTLVLIELLWSQLKMRLKNKCWKAVYFFCSHLWHVALLCPSGISGIFHGIKR